MGDFSSNLRAELSRRGWNQKDAAEHFGVSQQNVSRWLNEGHEPSIELLLKVARALGVTPNELLCAPGPAARPKRTPGEDEPGFGDRWFRQLRVTWQRHPDKRHQIKTAIELAWPNQAEDILRWLEAR
jgi:transcriptional regulator with XRE-family HTH domain